MLYLYISSIARYIFNCYKFNCKFYFNSLLFSRQIQSVEFCLFYQRSVLPVQKVYLKRTNSSTLVRLRLDAQGRSWNTCIDGKSFQNVKYNTIWSRGSREILARVRVITKNSPVSLSETSPNLEIFYARFRKQLLQRHEFRGLPTMLQALIGIALVHVPSSHHISRLRRTRLEPTRSPCPSWLTYKTYWTACRAGSDVILVTTMGSGGSIADNERRCVCQHTSLHDCEGITFEFVLRVCGI